MRVWLCRDPKVIRMADWLADQRGFMNWLSDPVQRTCRETAYEHVSRNVTVALCVTGLLVTWGSAREQGDREDDDLVLTHCDLETISAVADIPLFGQAMESVGWAEERDDGSVVFPKFFKEHESPEDKHRRQNADRQARHRAKQSRENNATDNVTNNVTVTHREEKRREVKPLRVVDDTGPFGLFWATWPKSGRKVAKAKCLDVWSRKGLDALADEICTHVEAMKSTDQWKRGYEPAPLTYLNQQRWRDGLPERQGPRLAI